MPNRLNRETSPYLLQHAGNPVDWYPWGPEAIECAKQENKPIFLSIGYSACHWCHVMEHESFEDERIAQAMNEHFVCIKVDREERPDLDQIYMSAVQMMTGRGGWPMSVFLTPELKPFYGGTYWPPTARMGMPGFDQVLSAVAEAWRDRQSLAREQADSLTGQIRAFAAPPGAAGKLESDILQRAVATLERAFDPRFGGFGAAPKFPHPMDLRLLLHAWRRKPSDELLGMVTLTLERMAAGGMYDQLGGGFHRYSVDERWLVPHFEKMLYDNALLAAAYLEGFLATKNQEYARVVHETCGYVLREMTGADGGLFSTQDADSEGEEGKFFLWTTQQLTDVLGAEWARTFAYVYDVTEEGNFEHRNILNMPKTFEQCAQILGRDAGDLRQELADSRAKLLAEREKRVHPALDDKVLLSWNGLMIDALAQASSALGESRYLIAAAGAATFVLERMRRPDGRMLHSWRQGAAKLDGYLDDYSCFINALVSLYEADFDERWIDEAVRLADLMVELFSDPSGGGFFFTARDHEQLISRQKDLLDNATPSGNSMAATALLRLGKLTGRGDFLGSAEQTMRAAAGLMSQSPSAMGQMILALDMLQGPTPEIVLLGDAAGAATRVVLDDLRSRYLPNKVVACRGPQHTGQVCSPALDELFASKQPAGPEPTVFVCQNFTCQAPLSGQEAAAQAWDELLRLARAKATRQ